MAGESEWSTGSPRTPNSREWTRLAAIFILGRTAGARAPAGPVHASASAARTFNLSIPPQRSLRRRQPGDRYPVGRAGHVVEPDGMAETHRRRLAAMLPADAELQVLPHPARLLDRQLHERPDPLLVDRLERVPRVDLELVDVGQEEVIGRASCRERGGMRRVERGRIEQKTRD